MALRSGCSKRASWIEPYSGAERVGMNKTEQNAPRPLPPPHVAWLVEVLAAAGFAACPVGGCVRDSLLGRTPQDWDVCTQALPQQVKRCFAGLCPVADTGLAHGTVTVVVRGCPVEVTTWRAESGYSDHRHPDTVRFVGDLRADLARRDFTINAMALTAKGIADPFGGQKDLAAGLVRCVGRPRQRFAEDALRILRALRFAACLDFTIEPDTLAAARQAAPTLRYVAAERVFSELQKLLCGPGAGRVLAEYGELLAPVLPGVERCLQKGGEGHWAQIAHAVGASPPSAQARWAALLWGLAQRAAAPGLSQGQAEGGQQDAAARFAKTALQTLKAPAALQQETADLVRWQGRPLPESLPQIRRWLGRLGLPRLQQVLAVKRAYLPAGATAEQARLERAEQMAQQAALRGDCVSLEQLQLKGGDLLQSGVCPPGPGVGALLRRALEEVMDGTVPNQKAALLAWARAQVPSDP